MMRRANLENKADSLSAIWGREVARVPAPATTSRPASPTPAVELEWPKPRQPSWDRFLAQLCLRADALGSFARHARGDLNFPKEPLDAVGYLVGRLAGPATVQVCRAAVRAYYQVLEAGFQAELAALRDRGGVELADRLEADRQESRRLLEEYLP